MSYYITWKDEQPYLCFIEDTYIFGIAAIYDCWQSNKDHPPQYTFCPLLTPASQRISMLGGEMPLILWASQYRAWLSSNTPLAEITRYFSPFHGKINAYPVSNRVNDLNYDKRDLYRPTGHRLHRKFKDVPEEFTEDRKGRKTVTKWKRVYLD